MLSEIIRLIPTVVSPSTLDLSTPRPSFVRHVRDCRERDSPTSSFHFLCRVPFILNYSERHFPPLLTRTVVTPTLSPVGYSSLQVRSVVFKSHWFHVLISHPSGSPISTPTLRPGRFVQPFKSEVSSTVPHVDVPFRPLTILVYTLGLLIRSVLYLIFSLSGHSPLLDPPVCPLLPSVPLLFSSFTYLLCFLEYYESP